MAGRRRPDARLESRYHPATKSRPLPRTGCSEEIPDTGPCAVPEGAMSILFVSFGVLLAIWIVVLWGSRYLGPQ
jgi:hypothetical protein